MSCLALSFGLLKYDWSKHDGVIPQTAVKSYTHNIMFNPLGEEMIDVYSLTMHNVQASDKGWYCCVATNKAGSTMECAWLAVNSKLHLAYNYIIAIYISSESFRVKLLAI